MSDHVREWVALAEAQGWRVETTSGDRLRFLSPNGVDQVVIGKHPTASSSLQNARAQLRRAGLCMEMPKKEKPVSKPEPVDVPAPDNETTSAAVDALVDMVNELATAHAELRKEHDTLHKFVEGEIVPMRRQVATILENRVTTEDMESMAREFAAQLARLERKADPIGQFRARLRGEQ